MIAPNALVIIKAAAFSQLLLEHADFLLAVVNDDLLGPVHPSGTADQDEGRGFMVQSSRQRTMATGIVSPSVPWRWDARTRIPSRWVSFEFSNSTGGYSAVPIVS